MLSKTSLLFIERVEKRLKTLGLSKRDFAERLGIKPSGINKILDKDTNPKLETLISVAKALECPLHTLIFDEIDLLYPGDRIEPTPLEALKVIERELKKQKVSIPPEIEIEILKLNPRELETLWHLVEVTLENMREIRDEDSDDEEFG